MATKKLNINKLNRVLQDAEEGSVILLDDFDNEIIVNPTKFDFMKLKGKRIKDGN